MDITVTLVGHGETVNNDEDYGQRNKVDVMPEELPIVSMAKEGEAVVIQRSLPEPVTYRGDNFIELSFLGANDDPKDFFTDAAFGKPASRGGRPFDGIDIDELRLSVHGAMTGGFSDVRIFPNVQATSTTLRIAEDPDLGERIESSAPISRDLRDLNSHTIAAALKLGKRLHVYRNLVGTLTYRFVSEPREAKPQILLVERYQLSTHLGQYGAGRVVKTFSLLPGETTKISVRSFLKTESQRKQASSILDSVTNESAEDFQSTLETEQSDKRGYQSTFEYHAEAEAKASWGFGSAKVSGGVKGGTNAAREEASKNLAKAVEQHAAKSSAKRDLEINTSFEVKETVEDETSIERQIENINVSRTLNFVFRQMNQEFFSLLHLTDVRVAFFNGFGESRREVPLHAIGSLLDEVVKPANHVAVRDAIDLALSSILDHDGVLHTDFVIDRDVGGESYRRVNRELVSEYKDPITGTTIKVPGIITAVTKNVMRTEGMIVESLLGEASALDNYATQLQEVEVERRRAEAARANAEAAHKELIIRVVEDNDQPRADLLEQLICPGGKQVTYHTLDDDAGEEA